uniref:KIAA0586 n=2 Tax=Nothobranchius korthausae TaxID=1143690 RepID=A0A1A8FH89_9TELE
MERPPRGKAGSRSDQRKGNVPEAAATPNSGAGSDRASSGQELLTLCFRTGGRGAGLGALRQCCYSPSHRREISAQLLPTTANPHRSAAQRGPAHVVVQPEAEPPGCLGETTTDPIKVQSDVEARVSQLADSLLTQLHTNRDCRPLQDAMTAGPQLPSLPSSILETRGDNHMLRGIEMKMQQQEASPESTKSAPHTLQNQPEYQQGHFQSNQNEFLQPCSDLLQSHQHHPHSIRPRFQQLPSSPAVFQQKPVPSHKVRCQISETNKDLQSQSARGQQRPAGRSMLEEAGQVLFHVQRRKKVLEDNLETLLNVKNGEILTCQLEALAANRDPTKEVQIKKTVDAWISILDTEVQTCKLPSPAAAGKSSQDAAHRRSAGAAASQVRSAGRGKPRQTRTRGLRAGHRVLQEAELSAVAPRWMGSQQEEVDAEAYLTRLYGKLPCEGLRRTLKKSPYPRFSSSASPLSKKPHPRLVESIRGVRLKSRKTQTSLSPPFCSSAGPHLHHRISSAVNSSSHDLAHITDAPAPHSFPVAMAIPLAPPRMDSSKHECAQHPGPLSAGMVSTEQEAAEHQLRPGEEKTPSPPPPTVDILDAEAMRNQEEEHESVFPGDDVNHLTSLCSSEEVCEIGEEAMLLDQGHGGPALPPRSPSPPHAQNVTPVLGASQHDALETRLVEWVKEQLMSRMYFDLHHPPVSDPRLYLADSEEPSRSSDTIVAVCSAEAAREDGQQLSVDSNTLVDSELIRLLVNEVLTETVAQVLGQRDASAADQGPGLDVSQSGLVADEEENLEVAVPTPAPTPLSGVTQSSREATPVTTPPSSEASSPVTKEPLQPITAPEPAATPTPSSEHEGSPTAHQAQPQLTWGDPKCPLEEERPEQQLDPDKQQLVMSVTEEEPPVCSPVPPPPLQPAPLESRLAPPSSSVEDLSSSISSSSSITATAETEAALKHISEAEVLVGVKQLGSLMEEEAVNSFSSSLHELQDMDFDPSALEPVRGHNLLLTLLTKMEEGVAHRGERLQPEGSWGRKEEEDEVSVGEVKPLQDKNSLLLGSTSSSGEISPAAAEGEEDKDIHPACIIPLEDGGVVGGERAGESPGAASEMDSSTTDVF